MNTLLAMVLALSSFGGLASGDRLGAFVPSDWSLSGGGAVSAYYDIGDTITAKSTQTTLRGNFLINESETHLGDYTVSITGSAEESWPVSKSVQIGIVPWYLDSNNYILVYMEWSPTERPTGMRVVEFTGRIDGQNPVVYKDGGFVQSEWNDAWMDGANEPYAIDPSSDWTFSVKKERSAAGDTDEFTAYINGNKVGFYGFRDVPKYSAKPAKSGIYCYNDNVTITDYSVTPVADDSLFHDIGGGYVGKAASGDWDVSGNTLSIDASSSVDPISSTIAITENTYEGNFRLKGTFASSSLVNNGGIGLVPWYQDETNYLTAYVGMVGGTKSLMVEGMVTAYSGGGMSQTPINDTLPLDSVENVGDISLIADKQGSRISLYLEGGEDNKLEVSNPAFATASYIGTAVSACNVSIDFESEALVYNSFDWYDLTLGGNKVSVKSATDAEGLFAYDEGTYTVSDEAVVSGDLTKQAALSLATSYVGEISVSADFAPLAEGQEYGLYPFLVDEDNYVRIGLKSDAFTVYLANNGTETQRGYVLPANFDSAASHNISAELASGTLNVTVDGASVVENLPVDGYDFSDSLMIGFFFAGKGGSVSNLSYSGFYPNSAKNVGAWTVYGPRPDTWTFDEENNTITGKYDGGTVWQATNALMSNEKADFWCASTINVSAVTASEHKVGLVPYYLDSNNYVFVWFSRWAGSTANTNVTVRINGQILPPEWGEREIGIQFEGTDNKLEAHIEGDTVSVYVSGAFAPVYTGNYPGLSERTLSGAKSGLNISNVSATFKDTVLGADDRPYAFNEKPSINEIGTRVTAGVVGERIALPIYTATNSNNDPLTAVVNVTDPSGEAVVLERNGFVPETAGIYHVEVTCTDDWGNSADPVSYDITVTEAQTGGDTSSEPDTGGNTGGGTTDPEGNGLGLMLGIVFGCLGGAAVIGLAIFLFIRYRNKKTTE